MTAPSQDWRQRIKRCAQGLWLAVGLLLSLPTWVAAIETTEDPLSLRQAQSLASEQPSPPQGDWEPVSLPEDWARSRPGFSGSVWYRLRFDRPAGLQNHELMAAWIRRGCSNVEVFLNGHAIHSGGRMEEPVSRHCYHPHLAEFSASLLRPQDNVLHVRLVGRSSQEVTNPLRAGGLSEIQIGRLDALQEHHRNESFWHHGIFAYTAPPIAVLALMLFSFSLLARVDLPMRHFGLLLLGSVASSARVWWVDAPWSNHTTEVLLACARIWTGVAGLHFLLRLARVERPGLYRSILAQGALFSLVMWISPDAWMYAAGTTVHLVMAAQVLFALAYCAIHMHRQSHPKAKAWLLLLPLAASSMMVDVLVQTGAMDLETAHWTLLISPILWAIIGAFLLAAVGQELHASETERLLLETRVREARDQLELSFQQLAEAQKADAARAERKRIAADLHDDLGAKLLTIVHTCSDDRIAALARDALEEMRLAVRGLGGKPIQLCDALGDWRSECVMRLSQAGVTLQWLAPGDDQQEVWLPARTYVQTTRILRESVSNLLKHSGASGCTIGFTVSSETFQMTIRDNGRGIALALDQALDRGHGLPSMKQRAQQLEGECVVESEAGAGTLIRLSLPLKAA